MKKILIVCLATVVYADNQNYFDNAWQLGKQNQFNLNLNDNSSFSTYAQANKIESNIVNGANTGNAGSKDVFNNASNDSNYLYNQGKREVINCQSRSDARCSTLNKYGDNDTLTQIQAYSQGISEKFYIHTRPDPADSQCSFVTRKVPINQSTATCISSGKDQNVCTTKVTPYNNYVPPVPADGSILAQGSNQDTSRAFCGVTASITSYETLTKQQKISVTVTSRSDDGGWNLTKRFDFGMSGGSYQYERQNDNNGNTNKTLIGAIDSSYCNGQTCFMTLTSRCSHGQLGGNDWNTSATVTLRYTMPKVSSRDIGYIVDDQCSTLKNSSRCKLVNFQCSDKTASKTIDDHTFNLTDMCNQYGFNSSQCCWNSTANYYCGDTVDTCDPYRKNSNCSLIDNTCIDKDYITGNCQKFQSKFTCSGGFQDVESRVCTNVVCANNESGTAKNCYQIPNPDPTGSNMKNFGSAIAYIQMGQNMAQDMTCTDNNPENCNLFAGKYYQCYMYRFKADQPGSWNNNGADCMVNNEFFTTSGVATGYANSDRNLYSHATSNSGNVMGSMTSYGLSGDDTKGINNIVKLQQNGNAPAVNQDQSVSYTPNSSRNSKINVNNGQVASVTINKDLVKDLGGISSFQSYLEDTSVNLAWNRLKGEPDPNNIKTTSFSALGVSRRLPGRPFGWNSSVGQPEINGLCVHLADSCEGGDDSATVSDLIKGQLSWAGGWTNPNFCAKCTAKVPLTDMCMTGEPRNVVQQWCCFTSKVAMDINIAAYDQGLMTFYTGSGNRYDNQVNHSNNICGGVTVGMVSRIDFSKADYFKDFQNSIDVNKLIDNSNFVDVNIQGKTQSRSNSDARIMINQWKQSNGN